MLRNLDVKAQYKSMTNSHVVDTLATKYNIETPCTSELLVNILIYKWAEKSFHDDNKAVI